MSDRQKPPILSDPLYQRLKARVIERTGMAFYAERDDDLARILGERFTAVGVRDCGRYLEMLSDRAELDELVAELTIGETYFFRYREQFDALRDMVLPDAIERNRGSRRLRIWSAGCATGPEPYSVAILLKHSFGQALDGWDVTIFGTDINQKFLARAREGVYDDWAFRATPEAVRNTCFQRAGRQWRIAPEYQAWVRFHYHNLVDDAFPSMAYDIRDLDIILCRNVVIYFTTATFRQIIGSFRESLVEGGWLMVGHSELNTELFKSFRTVEAPGAVLYQKSALPDHRLAPALLALPPEPPVLAEIGRSEAAPAAPAPPPEPPSTEVPPLPVPEAGAETPLADLHHLADQGIWLEVGRLARKLLADEPLDPMLHVYNGLALEHAGSLAGAIEAMRRAVYLDRALALAHYHLGRLLREYGDGAGSLRSFRNALRLVKGLDPEAVVPGSGEMAVAELTELLELQIEGAR